MRIIDSKTHGFLDYLVVLSFLSAPTLFHFSTVPAAVSYALAGIHLILTLLTDFPLGMARVIPLKFHGFIEMIVGPCLVALPFILGFKDQPTAFYFYAATGILIFAVWALTDYGKVRGR